MACRIRLLLVVCLYCIAHSAWAVSLPQSILNWKVPSVKMEGGLILENGQNETTETYNIQSWFLGDTEEIHVLDSRNNNDTRLVLYYQRQSTTFSYWSKGNAESLAMHFADSASKRDSVARWFSVLTTQRGMVEELTHPKELIVTQDPLSNDYEGTITLRENGIAQGQGYRDDSWTFYHYRDGKLISYEKQIQGNDLETGQVYGPYMIASIVFPEYSSEFPGIPLRCLKTNWFPPGSGKIIQKGDWQFHRVSAIPEGTTMRKVLSELTKDLTFERWPAKTTMQVEKEQKQRQAMRFTIGVILVVCLLLALRKVWRLKSPSTGL